MGTVLDCVHYSSRFVKPEREETVPVPLPLSYIPCSSHGPVKAPVGYHNTILYCTLLYVLYYTMLYYYYTMLYYTMPYYYYTLLFLIHYFF